MTFMRNRKSYLLKVVAGLALIGMGALVSPRRSEAQFASPVRVMNTSAAPALNSRIDDPGRIPFIAGFSNSCSGSLCSTTFLSVPAGHRVVIEHVSATLSFNAAPGTVVGFVSSTGPTSPVNFAFSAIGNAALFDVPVLYYVDGGQSPVVQFSTCFVNCGVAFNPNAAQNLTLVGYELDCNAAPCSAIATR
jgi:hypothetical protein